MTGSPQQKALADRAESWITKGGAGAMASVLIFMGNSFIDKQDLTILELKALTSTINDVKTNQAILATKVQSLENQFEKLKEQYKEAK